MIQDNKIPYGHSEVGTLRHILRSLIRMDKKWPDMVYLHIDGNGYRFSFEYIDELVNRNIEELKNDTIKDLT